MPAKCGDVQCGRISRPAEVAFTMRLRRVDRYAKIEEALDSASVAVACKSHQQDRAVYAQFICEFRTCPRETLDCLRIVQRARRDERIDGGECTDRRAALREEREQIAATRPRRHGNWRPATIDAQWIRAVIE